MAFEVEGVRLGSWPFNIKLSPEPLMSQHPGDQPTPHCDDTIDGIETLIVPRARDLGSFEVRRALPAPKRQMVGPFILFDHMGPAEMLTAQGISVRPHPHTGLSTVTYMFEGEMRHRDSLGTDQVIAPGAVNWMVSGQGIAHSERMTDASLLNPTMNMHGIQTWVALPLEHEHTSAKFEHHVEASLPVIEDEGIRARLILGSAFGERAPVTVHSEMFYMDVVLKPGTACPLPDDHEDRGAYIVHGEVEVAGQRFGKGRMMVFRPGDSMSMRATEQGARVMLLGGATFPQRRYISWNFVSSSREGIRQAKLDWMDRDNPRFVLPPGDTEEFMLLPEPQQPKGRR